MKEQSQREPDYFLPCLGFQPMIWKRNYLYRPRNLTENSKLARYSAPGEVDTCVMFAWLSETKENRHPFPRLNKRLHETDVRVKEHARWALEQVHIH